MPRTTQARVFFGNGEWDPRLWGRVDLPGYENALAIMDNFFPTALGGARYRDGLRTRFVLPGQRDPARMKMVRAPGYLGAAERILVLDGTTGSGVIEAFAFPYEGNTRFTRTDVWTQSQSRVSPDVFVPLSGDIYRARVAFGDYAGTMITHRSFAPLHIGSSAITSTLLTNSRVLLAIDGTTSHIWQLSRTSPAQSIDLGRMPSGFFNASAMTSFNGEILAVSVLGILPRLFANVLWLVDRSNPRASTSIGTMNITDTPVTGLATDGTTLYACTRSNQIWNVNRDITSACTMVGTLPPAGITYQLTGMTYANGRMYGVAEIPLSGLAVSTAAILDIDLSDLANTQVGTGISESVAEHDPVSLAAYGSELVAGRTASGDTRADLVSVDLAANSFTDLGDLPAALQRPSAIVGFDVQLNATEQLGDLLNEQTERSTANPPPMAYFQPKNYVDHLGNHMGEGAHPSCSTVFLNRMIFAGSDYLPGTFIGSERYPRSNADLGIEDAEAQGGLSYLFDGLNGEAVATYNFYWLFYHPLKRALETWEAVTAGDSFSYKINAQRELTIVWMVPYNNYLVLGTTEGVWIARDLSPDTPPEVTQYSNIPCADVDPVVTDFGIAYADSSRKEVHFANLGVGFEPPVRQNAMAFARHLTDGTTIRQLAWQATPQRRLWLLTDDGRLAAWCFEPDANVLGWARVTNRFLLFCGVCVIPGPEVELACVAAYEPSEEPGLKTIYMTTLDGRDHLDLGEGINIDIGDDAIVPIGDIIDPFTGLPIDVHDVGPATLRVAIALPRRSIELGGMMELLANASGSEAGPHTVEWSIVSGPGMLSSLTERRTTYTAPDMLDEDTEVTVRVVARGVSLTASDDATFTISTATLIVTLTNLQTVFEGESARIDAVVTGTATGPITYSWSIVSGPGTLTPSSDGSYATFAAPASVSGAMSVTVACTVMRAGRSAVGREIFNVDDIMLPPPCTLSVSISSTPGAVGEWDLSASVGGTCAGSVTYAWTISGGGSLTSTSGSTTSVTGGISGSTVVGVDVERAGQRASDARILTAPPPVTLTVNITGATTVDEGGTLQLTANVGGTATGDITYSWAVISGLGSIPTSGGATNTYTAPATISADTTATVRVTVSRQNLIERDEHVITIRDTDEPEEALTAEISVTSGALRTASVIVGGTATGTITYSWTNVFTAIGGTQTTFTASTATFQFTGPFAGQQWDLSVTIQRGGHSATASLTLTP